MRPRSYLIIPNLNRSKKALLSRYNIVWLPMTAGEFYDSVLVGMNEERHIGNRLLAQGGHNAGGSTDHFSRVSDLAEASKTTEEYLLGAEPTWADVSDGRVAQRDCFDELWNKVKAIRADATHRHLLIVTGTAGTGKSSALMSTAMHLEADGVAVAWLDATSQFSRYEFKKALANGPTFGALFIDDADTYDARLPSMVVDALETNARLLVVCEMRSTKVDRVVYKQELVDIEHLEYTIPPLGDGDIDTILDVLDNEHRLGLLKGKSRNDRRQIFQKLAGRQLLVAMHIATHGKDFEDKAKEELNEMTKSEQFVYGLICIASAHRFSLRQEDIGIACADDGTAWLQSLNKLNRRKIILPQNNDRFRARHRMIAQFVYDSLVQAGKLHDILRGLVLIGTTKTTKFSGRNSQYSRLLRTFINHNLMKRGVDVMQARQIYSDFEDALSWNYHFWLHRGALELETGSLDRAENFLNQAKSINETDIFVDNELAYLDFKKANLSPSDRGSPALVENAITTLNNIVRYRSDQIPHAYHIMGQQGLLWVESGINDPDKKREFLEYLSKKVLIAVQKEPNEMMKALHKEITHALYSLAIPRDNKN